MNLKERSTGLSVHPQRWLAVCVIIGLVVGAGGLLPSLLGGNLAWPAVGANGSNSGPDAVDLPAGPSPAAMLGRLAAGTILVLALCAGTLPLLKRWLVASPVAKVGGAFEIIATLQLNGRCTVCLVRAGGQHLLAGSDAAGLQALVPVGDVPADSELSLPEAPPPRRVPAGIEPRRLTAV